MVIQVEPIQSELVKLSKGNEEYARFNQRIVNTKKIVIGVRLPDLRKLARDLAKNASDKDIENYLLRLDKTVYEQVLLAGIIISYAPLPDGDKIKLTKKYLKLVDSWAEIDSFVLKRKKFNKELWWSFVIQSLGSGSEFTVRYGVIELMSNFLNEKYIDEVFKQLRNIMHDGYYVLMGIAWLYATAAVKYYEQTLAEIRSAIINPWTKRKALTKMLESYQFTTGQKAEIRELRADIKQQRLTKLKYGLGIVIPRLFSFNHQSTIGNNSGNRTDGCQHWC